MGARLSGLAHGLGIALLLWSVPLGAAVLVRAGLTGAQALAAVYLVGAAALAGARPGCDRAAAGRFGAGLVVGFASFPFWIAASFRAGLALGLGPPAPVPAAAGAPLDWIVALVLAPVFEEFGYRGRLLPALARCIGAPAAICVSSLLFALPHLEAWNVLAAFGVGLGLGALAKLSGSTAACVGIHAGLNLAALVHGVPPLPG